MNWVSPSFTKFYSLALSLILVEYIYKYSILATYKVIISTRISYKGILVLI
jgi:hypothetical protein